MNQRSKKFIDDYYQDIVEAEIGAEEILEQTGDYDTDPQNAIRSCFLVSSLAYIEFCGERVTDELATFIMDTYFYMNETTIDCIYDFSVSQKRDYIFECIERLDKRFFTLDGLADFLRNPLDICDAFDKANDATTKSKLCRALTQYSYLLIKADDRITKGEDEFYSFFKVGLSHALTDSIQDNHKPKASQDRGDTNVAVIAQSNSEAELKRLTSEIDSLIGLNTIKQEVSDLLNLLRVQQMREKSGLPSIEMSRHMVFYGNPGTGKTTIARKLSEIYKVLGILSKGHLVETDRSALVAGYLGQTAIKTKEVLEKAKGGILFIDEAYSLCQGGEQDQYGQEAIDTLLKYMEDNRDDLLVIVAGYNDKMAAFIDSNPGLKSRFSKYFHFPDYTSQELCMIFKEMSLRSQYHATDEFSETLERICELMVLKKEDNFGNGRTVRNLFEKCVSNQANRVISLSNPTQEQLAELTGEDISFEDIEFIMR